MRATQVTSYYRMMSALTVTFYLITIALLSSNILLTTEALASPAARRKAARKSSKKSSFSSGGGFAKKPPKHQAIINPAEQYDYAAQDEVAKRAVSRLFSVCAHIQDPKLYMPKWADACSVKQQGGAVMANRDVARGQVLTLFPIHALGLRMLSQSKDDTEFVAYDQDTDGDLFRPTMINNNANLKD